MNRIALVIAVVLASLVWMGQPSARADYPKPSVYPIAWELNFKHGMPQRIVVEVPGQPSPKAYWYLTYRVTNNTGEERMFLPRLNMLSDEGNLIRSDKSIPPQVFTAIKTREKNQFLENAIVIASELRLGEDEARDGVAIWAEPNPEMGRFAIFIEGLSGEYARVQNSAGEDVTLRKTLQLNYLIRGDEVFPGEDEVNEDAEVWVMR